MEVEGKTFEDDERRPCLFVSVPRILAEEQEGGERSRFSAVASNAAGSYISQPSSSTGGVFRIAWDVFLSNSSKDI